MKELKTQWNTLPNLGVGLSYRPHFSSSVFKNQDRIQFLEIIADHYLDAPREKMEELAFLQDRFVLIPHAINLSLGSAEKPDIRYLDKLAALIDRVSPPYWSEHISFTKIEGIEIGHLSPIPYTQEAIEVFSENVKTVKQSISTPLILENISYLVNIPENEMTEEQFISEILENTDCGLLLDLTNLVYNASNNGYSVERFLNGIPLDRVIQFHFTGGIYKWDKFIDNHSSPTPEEVWQLMEALIHRTPVRGAVLERDDLNPDWNDMAIDLEKAKWIWQK